MIDWSDLTGELPAASGPPPMPTTPAPVRPTSPPEPPRRPAEPRTGALRAEPPRPGAGGPGLAGPGPVGPPPPLPGPIGPPPGPAGPGLGAGPDALVTTGMIRRAELRKHLKVRQQLKSVTLTLVVLMLLAAYPVYLFVQSLAQDPVFSSLDALDLPEWSAYSYEDAADGSRWCIENCRFRSRTWMSEKGPDETQVAYVQALNSGGWRPYDGACQQTADDSVITCWQKDEYVMVMHVRAPLCEAPPPRDPLPGATESTAPEPTDTRPACPGAYVTMSISNAIDYQPPPQL
jgi:integrin beta 3